MKELGMRNEELGIRIPGSRDGCKLWAGVRNAKLNTKNSKLFWDGWAAFLIPNSYFLIQTQISPLAPSR